VVLKRDPRRAGHSGAKFRPDQRVAARFNLRSVAREGTIINTAIAVAQRRAAALRNRGCRTQRIAILAHCVDLFSRHEVCARAAACPAGRQE